MNNKPLIIIGAGGHAKVVYNSIVNTHPNRTISFADDNRGGELLGATIYCPIKEINHLTDFVVHIAIGNNHTRKLIIDKYELHASLITIVDISGILSGFSCVGKGAFIAASSIVAIDSIIGISTIINHGAIIDHDCIIGDYCHVAPNATLSGNVEIGDGVFIGANATVLPGIKIGAWSTVGAGAVVTENVGLNQIVKGIPAK